MDSPVFDQVAKIGVVAVLIIDSAEQAVPLAEALLEGGIGAMELTLRTNAAIPALKKIRAAVPDMIAGIGTVLTPDQVKEVVDCGASFGVAPGMNPRVVEAALKAGLPFAPGIATPSEVEQAIDYGLRVLKFFPAEPIGGLPYLQAIAAPYAHLGLRFMPLGGLNAVNMGDYLRQKFVAAIGGSWLASKESLAAGDWAGITAKAAHARNVAKSSRA